MIAAFASGLIMTGQSWTAVSPKQTQRAASGCAQLANACRRSMNGTSRSRFDHAHKAELRFLFAFHFARLNRHDPSCARSAQQRLHCGAIGAATRQLANVTQDSHKFSAAARHELLDLHHVYDEDPVDANEFLAIEPGSNATDRFPQ